MTSTLKPAAGVSWRKSRASRWRRTVAALFPDAPTQRGVRHLRELISAVKSGYDAYAVFIVQMKGVRYMAPNRSTHAAFGDALAAARRAGVGILAVDCNVTETSIAAAELVEVRIGVQ